MNGLDLFAGSGIGSLALKHTIPNYRSVGYVEWNKYCCGIIAQRIRDGVLCDAPVYHLDIREFNRRIASMYKGLVDIIAGGFPCQPFSHAGKRQGKADERNMWPATIECLRIIRPQYAFLENVPGLFTHEYVRRIFGDLAEIGYNAQFLPLSAAEVGANHKRERIWILANDMCNKNIRDDKGRFQHKPTRSGKNVADTGGMGRKARASDIRTDGKEIGRAESNISNQTSGEIHNSECLRKPQSEGSLKNIGGRSGNSGQQISHVTKPGLEGEISESQFSREQSGLSAECGWWSTEPNVGRVAHGVAFRVDRLKMLGNGWVPHVVKRILLINEYSIKS